MVLRLQASPVASVDATVCQSNRREAASPSPQAHQAEVALLLTTVEQHWCW